MVRALPAGERLRRRELCELVRLRGEMAAPWRSRVVKAVWHIRRERDARGIFATYMHRYITERVGGA